MASKTVKWLVGCGLGCLGTCVIVIVLLVVGSSSVIRNTTEGFEKAVQSRDELNLRFGDPGDFVPAVDGRIAADRVEAFLSVREATRPAREGVEKFFRALPTSRDAVEALDDQPPLKKLGSIFGITKSAFGLGADLGNIFRARNQGLIDVDMGLGEYTYIYVVVYVSWLGHRLDEGPEFEGADDAAMVDRDVVQRVRDDLLDMLRAQLSAVPDDESMTDWRAALADEVARLESDDQSVPWQLGLPEPLEASLAPFREQLETGFSPYSNPFELGRARKRGRFSFDVE